MFGFQLSTPLGVIVIPAGALVPRLKVRVLAGMFGSGAVLVITHFWPARIETFVTAVNTGGLFVSSTVTVKLLLALKGGTPLSVTTTVTGKLEQPVASPGVQLNTPLAVIVIPAGALAPRLKMSALLSGSVALLVTVSVNPSI